MISDLRTFESGLVDFFVTCGLISPDLWTNKSRFFSDFQIFWSDLQIRQILDFLPDFFPNLWIFGRIYGFSVQIY